MDENEETRGVSDSEKFKPIKQKKMNEEEIRVWIKTLKQTLTGNLLEDMETQQRIYELKIKLNPEIAQRPELDDDECLSCGS